MRLHKQAGEAILKSESQRFAPRYALEGDELLIWGVITFSVRAHETA